MCRAANATHRGFDREVAAQTGTVTSLHYGCKQSVSRNNRQKVKCVSQSSKHLHVQEATTRCFTSSKDIYTDFSRFLMSNL